MSRIYGTNAVSELLDNAPEAVERILYAEDQAETHGKLLDKARGLGVDVRPDHGNNLRQRSGGRGGASLGADIRTHPARDLHDLDLDSIPFPLIVALDRVTDPHNVGAILRSAAALGAHAVIAPKDGSAPLNDAAVRASCGAVAYMPYLRVTNLARTLRELRDRDLWTIATEADAPTTLWQVDLTLPSVIVLGAEGPGVRPGVAKVCEVTASLPLVGAVRSLNVSVTAGIALAEAARQRASAGFQR
jgi:23S rRNA (guanosine2251-2'-O)-methyltransferase